MKYYLRTVQFSEPFFNDSRNIWSILAYVRRLEAAQIYGYRLTEEISAIELNLTLAEEEAEENAFTAFAKATNVMQQLEQSYKTARLFSIFTPDA